DGPPADLAQLPRLIEDPGARPEFESKKIGDRNRKAVQNLLERAERGADAVLLDERNRAVGDARAAGQLALGEAVHPAQLAQPRADIGRSGLDILERRGGLGTVGAPEITRHMFKILDARQKSRRAGP